MSVRSRVRLLLCGGCWATCVPMRQRPGMGTVSWVKIVALGLDLSRLDGLNPAIPMLDIGHPRLETSESNCSDRRPTRSPQVICNHLRQAEKSAGRNWSPKEALKGFFWGENKPSMALPGGGLGPPDAVSPGLRRLRHHHHEGLWLANVLVKRVKNLRMSRHAKTVWGCRGRVC